MAAFHPNDLLQGMRPDSLKVRAPTEIVFLCGGAVEPNLPAPAVLRDAFSRAATLAGVPYKIVLAEEAKPLSNDADYSNLLSFESDIAQVVGLILLFVESAGSLAELGAFAALDTIAPNLLAVLDNYYYDQPSFIRDGPVRYLEKKHGDVSVHVLDRAEVGIDEHGGIANLHAANFASSMLPVVQDRLNARPEWVKLDVRNSGHAILLMVGLCRELGAMTQSEIRTALTTFGVQNIRFDNFVYCAELLGWLKRVRKGNHIFFVAPKGNAALDYTIKKEVPLKSKERWRSDIREFWEKHDRPRFNAISELTAEALEA